MSDIVAFLRARLDEDERIALRVLRFSRESYVQGAYEAWGAERRVNNAEPPYYDYRLVRTDRHHTGDGAEIVRLSHGYRRSSRGPHCPIRQPTARTRRRRGQAGDH